MPACTVESFRMIAPGSNPLRTEELSNPLPPLDRPPATGVPWPGEFQV